MSSGLVNVRIIVIALGVGALVAMLGSVYIRNILGGLVRALQQHGADSETTAISLRDLKMDRKFFVLYSLRRSSALRRVVNVTGQNSASKNILADTGLYIPAANQERAERIYGKQGIRAGEWIIGAVLLVAVFVAAYFVVPQLIIAFKNALER